MKTAEEVIQLMKEEMPYELPKQFEPYIKEALHIYGRQCAEQALKDAGVEIAKMYKDAGYTNTGIKAKNLIEATTILTP